MKLNNNNNVKIIEEYFNNLTYKDKYEMFSYFAEEIKSHKRDYFLCIAIRNYVMTKLGLEYNIEGHNPYKDWKDYYFNFINTTRINKIKTSAGCLIFIKLKLSTLARTYYNFMEDKSMYYDSIILFKDNKTRIKFIDSVLKHLSNKIYGNKR